MSRQRSASYVLPAEGARALLEMAGDTLESRILEDGPARPFILLDTFDQRLGKSGRLLLQCDGCLHLLADGGQRLAQAASGGFRFVADLADGPVREALADISPLRSLLSMGSGQWWQGACAFVDDVGKTRARMRLDSLSTREGEASTLVTLHGLRGYGGAFDMLSATIEASGGQPLSTSGLSQRLFPERPDYDPRPDVPIAPDASARDVATGIIAACLPVARANEQGIREDLDTEFLHDYRVALRKIRSVLSLFKGVYDDAQTEALARRFSALMARTGPLRDLDVYLLEREQFAALVPASLHPGLDRMFDIFAARRAAELTRLRRHLGSPSYLAEMSDLERHFRAANPPEPGAHAQDPAIAFASRLIRKRYRKICAIADALDDSSPDEDVHRLRIQCKKLRYLMEFFAPAFGPGDVAALLKPLKRLQDNLGLFNDYSVQQTSLQAFVDGLSGVSEQEKLELAQSVGALIAVLYARQQEERRKVVANFERFNDSQTRKRFRSLLGQRKDRP
ncbi:CHAD domain-containing protein [Sulfitobacter sp. LCG007]